MHLARSFSFVFLTVAIFPSAIADFSLNFKNFVRQIYGESALRQLERPDMGLGLSGSFGGRTFDTDIIRHDPILFVHAAAQRAGNFIGNYFYFLGKGYNAAELFATTYGDGGLTPKQFKTLACDDVKQIRAMLLAVNAYTNRTVDIIAFGEGVPIARKAILGGTCVDTKEALGSPMTSSVDTFISVAGVGYGKASCNPQQGGCNLNNGMICTSAFLTDINNGATRYEGRYSYYIYSDNDAENGQTCCSHLCSELRNANAFSRQSNMLHDSIMALTNDLQYSMLRSNGQYSNNTLYPTTNYGFGINAVIQPIG